MHKHSIQGSKLHVYSRKQYCLARQTQVFHPSNNIVWQVKQYCFAIRIFVFADKQQ